MYELLRSLASPFGVLLRRDAVAIGIDDDALRRYVKTGRLVRIRQGAYALADRWSDSDPPTRQLMLVDAVMRQYGDHVALSHSSAAIVQGGPNWGLELSDVHLTHFLGAGRRSAGIIHHQGACLVDDLTRVDGHWITSPARTVLDTASIVGPEAGMVLASDFLHRGLTTHEQLVRLHEAHRTWPDTLAHHVMLLLADGRFESVAEARFAYLIWRYGIAKPEPQWEVRHPNGRVAGRFDFAWPEKLVAGEVDGKIKYTALRGPGESVEDVVLREKRRTEELLELSGYRMMLRFGWADIEAPERTAARLRRALE